MSCPSAARFFFLNGTASLFPAIEISVWQLPRLAPDAHHRRFILSLSAERSCNDMQEALPLLCLTERSRKPRRTSRRTRRFSFHFVCNQIRRISSSSTRIRLSSLNICSLYTDGSQNDFLTSRHTMDTKAINVIRVLGEL